MAFFDNLIKKLWNKDKDQRIVDDAKGVSVSQVQAAATTPGGLSHVDGSSNYDKLAQDLSVDTELIYRYIDYENMDDYPETCLAGSELVFTTERGWVSIQELAETGEEFHVLAYDKESRKLVPAMAAGAAKTGDWGHSKPMVEVVMHDGNSVHCTADHRFMMADGEWSEAGDLKHGDSLMCGVARLAPNDNGMADGPSDLVHEVIRLESRCPVYDITVPGYHNFVCNGLVVHNSAALDYYADDSTIPDAIHGKSIWATSSDKVVRDVVDDCLHRRIKIEEDLWVSIRTLCKYGNLFAEVVVSDIGVVGLNWLPVATMRRIVNEKGALIGFVQDVRGAFNFSFSEAINAFNKQGLPKTEENSGLTFFHPWEVVHWRLRGKQIQAQYGTSVLDSARWIWKRLQLMEDTALVQKLCLRGDSQIWTDTGRKAIRDLVEGDTVYSYTEEDRLVPAKVVFKKHNGRDKLYRIKSSHRELYANETHPVLVETIVKNGSGSKRGRRVDYVEVKDLVPGVHRLMTPNKDNDLSEKIPLVMPEVGRKARLSARALEDGVALKVGPKRIHDEFGADINYVKAFFRGEKWMKADTVERILEANGTSLDYLDTRPDWGGVKALNLPEFVTEDFARWFGFMIGDGYVSEVPFKRKGREYHVRRVGFTCGSNEEINKKYTILFEKFFGRVKFENDSRSQSRHVGKREINSKALYEFMLLNGFIPGAHNKRVPEWVFMASVSVRQAFLEGLADADAHVVEGSVSEERSRVSHQRMVLEMCNRELVEDVRELAMQTGYMVGAVNCRFRKGGREILNNGFPLPDRISYILEWSLNRQPISETLKSVEAVEVDDIWDIGVDSSEHNFVANGIVVHNTRSPSRYAFYVDTGDLPPREAMALVNKVKRGFKKKKLVDPSTGKLDFRYNVLNPSEDFWIPTRGGQDSTRVEVISGPDVQMMDDVQYFQKKLVTAIKVPPGYLGLGEDDDRESIASQKDVRFARACMRIQREYKLGLRKVCRTHMAALNIDPDSVDWQLRMSIPSSIFEMQQIEILNAQSGAASSLQDYMPKPWILERVFHFTKDDAAYAIEQKAEELDSEAKAEAGTQADIMRMYPEVGQAGAQEAAGGEEGAPPAAEELTKAIRGLQKVLTESNKRMRRTIRKSGREMRYARGMMTSAAYPNRRGE